MKILQVIPYFPPAYSFGGPVKMAHQFSQELVKRGHDVVVCTSDAKDLNSRLELRSVECLDGIRVHYFRNLFLFFVTSFKLFITPQLILYARKEVENFDVIHLHEYRTFQNIVIAYYAKKHDVPYVLHAHGSLPRLVAKQKLKSMFDLFFGYALLKGASKVIALNSFEVKQYMHMGVPEENIAIVPNGIDFSEYAVLPAKGCFKRKFGIDDDAKIVLYVGRLHSSKGLDLLAHAFKLVSRSFSNVKLVLVGPDDGYATSFSMLLSNLGIVDLVLFTGFVEKNDKLAAFVDCDVFITPRFSGFPVTFLEACLVGCPIVTASDELDWINNVGFVTEDSSYDFAKAISNVLEDTVLHMVFRNNCNCLIKNFDISTVINQLETIYKEVISHGCFAV